MITGGSPEAAASAPAGGRAVPAVALLFFAAVCLFRLFDVSFANDHFDRISKGRQILAFGAVPFRDFFDPGFFLTLYSSAAMQAVFGHALAGEALLTIGFIAGGFTCAFLLARRVSGSTWLALAITTAAVLTLPRLYNYDKVLFFPLVLIGCARYLERPNRFRLATLAAVTVVAALYRYDSGVYTGLASAVAIVWAQPRQWRGVLTRAATYAAFAVLFAAPALIFVERTAGLPEAARQIREYGVREGLRTEIFRLPTFIIDAKAPVLLIGIPVKVRWSAAVTGAERLQLEAKYGLARPEFDNGRTWSYRLRDVSETNVTQLVRDSHIEDTSGFDRSVEGIKAIRQSVALLPGILTVHNSAAWLACVLLALPLLTLATLPVARPAERGLLLAIAALCLTADMVLLRDPLEARIGDVAAPAVPLAAWLVAAIFTRSRVPGARRLAAPAVAVAAIVATGAGLVTLAIPALRAPGDWSTVRRLVTTPPDRRLMPSAHTLGIANYLQVCTASQDRVLATWFAPEIYYFSGRGFAGGMSVFFGGHWSAPEEQQRIVLRLQRERAPVALVDLKSFDEFRHDYPVVAEYLERVYVPAADSAFGDSEAEYRLLVRRGLSPTGAYEPFNVPCFR